MTSKVDFLECLELAAAGKLNPVIQRYPLEEMTRAREDMDNRRVFGRAVLIT